jgi:CRP-like cAMP-binding protein
VEYGEQARALEPCEIVEIPAADQDVARMTGARREVVSGLLNRLRENGVVSYSRKGALRLDRDNLDHVLQSFAKRRQRGK